MTEHITDRFSRLMSRLQDMTLLVLKGHLLIEEQLEYFLEQATRAPGQLVDARLSYAQKLQLVRALSGMSGEMFDFAKAINGIRNSLGSGVGSSIEASECQWQARDITITRSRARPAPLSAATFSYEAITV
jgi:hypothetical protein